MQYYKWCGKSSKITIYNFLASIKAPSASVVGEIKDASWSRDVTSVVFWPGVIWNGKDYIIYGFGDIFKKTVSRSKGHFWAIYLK